MRITTLISCLVIILSLAACQTHRTPQEREQKAFKIYVYQLRKEALKAGIPRQTVDRYIADIKFLRSSVKSDKTQPQTRMTFTNYSSKFLSPTRLDYAHTQAQLHQPLLKQISREYQIPEGLIVALWSAESNAGRHTGKTPILSALATMSFEGRRRKMFTNEFIAALRILEKNPEFYPKMKGSWDGGMGQAQFMPTSYLRFAEDYSHDGKIDLWDNPADVFASIANYMKKAGWNYREPWGFAVQLPTNFDKELASLKVKKTVREWQKLGVKFNQQASPVNQNIQASILIFDDHTSTPVTFLVLPNFHVIRSWNKSNFYATTIGLMSNHFERKIKNS